MRKRDMYEYFIQICELNCGIRKRNKRGIKFIKCDQCGYMNLYDEIIAED